MARWWAVVVLETLTRSDMMGVLHDMARYASMDFSCGLARLSGMGVLLTLAA